MSNVKYIPLALAAAADPFAGTVTSDRIKVPGTGKLHFLVVNAVGATGTATITANCFAAATGGTGTAVGFRYKHTTGAAHEVDSAGGYSVATTAGFLPAAGSNKSTLIEFRFDETVEGKPFVELTSVEGVDSPVVGYILASIVDGDRPGSGVSSL